MRNLGRMRERRSMLRLLVAYDTPPGKIDEVPRLVEKVVRAQRGTRFLQCLLNTLGSYTLEFEAIYYIENQPQYPPGQINDAINRGVFRELNAAGIRLAVPTQQLVMNAPGPTRDCA